MTKPAALFWHVYAVQSWYDISAEILLTLRRARFPFPIHAVVVGREHDALELERLAGMIGVPIETSHTATNDFEWPTLHAAWQHARMTEDRICYIHNKGVTRQWPTYTKWRWTMAVQILLHWQDRVRDLDEHDAAGVCYRADWPCFAGNWWWATASWLRTRPEPQRNANRFSHERWLLQGHGPAAPNIKPLVSVGGEPCQEEYYVSHGMPYREFLACGTDSSL